MGGPPLFLCAGTIKGGRWRFEGIVGAREDRSDRENRYDRSDRYDRENRYDRSDRENRV